MQSYARLKKVLVQTHVSPTVSRRLDAMAKNNGHKRASYLRYLIETHVGALNPRPPARKTEGRR
jgi:predicted DNA-binding protein